MVKRSRQQCIDEESDLLSQSIEARTSDDGYGSLLQPNADDAEGFKIGEQSLQYRPDVDGLRAVAVAAVVVYHMSPMMLAGGYRGVDIFFVISGYVVTASFMRNLKSDAKFAESLMNFFAQRTKRLLPCLFIVCTASGLAFAIVTPWQDTAIAPAFFETAVAGLAGNANHWLLYEQLDYFRRDAMRMNDYNPFNHFWSLGVEEQFYLLLPLLMAWAKRSSDSTLLLLVLCILGFTSMVASWYFQEKEHMISFYVMPCRFWELAAGAALSLASKRIHEVLMQYQGVHYFLQIFVGLSVTSSLVIERNEHAFPFPTGVLAVAGTVCYIATGTVVNRLSFNSILSLGLPVYVGRISYSIYLWHKPVLAIGMWASASGLSPIVSMPLILFLSIASFHLIENPLRHHSSTSNLCVLLFSVTLALSGILWLLALDSFKKTMQPNSQPLLNYMCLVQVVIVGLLSCLGRGPLCITRIIGVAVVAITSFIASGMLVYVAVHGHAVEVPVGEFALESGKLHAMQTLYTTSTSSSHNLSSYAESSHSNSIPAPEQKQIGKKHLLGHTFLQEENTRKQRDMNRKMETRIRNMKERHAHFMRKLHDVDHRGDHSNSDHQIVSGSPSPPSRSVSHSGDRISGNGGGCQCKARSLDAIPSPPSAVHDEEAALSRCFPDYVDEGLLKAAMGEGRGPCNFAPAGRGWSGSTMEQREACIPRSNQSAIYLFGDSHAYTMKPALEVGTSLPVFGAFWNDKGPWIPNYLSNALSKVLKPGDIVAYMICMCSDAREQNIYKTDVEALYKIVLAKRAKLLLFRDSPSFEGKMPMASCTSQVAPTSCLKKKSEVDTQQAGYLATLNAFKNKEDVYTYSWADNFCDRESCDVFIRGTKIPGFEDQHHPSRAAALYVAPFLCSFLRSNLLSKVRFHASQIT